MAKIKFGGSFETPCHSANCYVTVDGFMNLVHEWIIEDRKLTEFSVWHAEQLESLARRIRASYKEEKNQ